MILFGVLATLIPLSYCQNAVLGFEKTCYKVDDTLTIDAVYNGTGTPQLVTWTYSGSNLIVETTGCTLFNNVPAGFPTPSRITQKCVTTDLSLPENTYQLIVSDLLKDELGKTWAVTFTPPVGAAPTAVQSPVPSDCSNCKCECDCECRTIVIVSIVFGTLGALCLLIVVGIPAGVIVCKLTSLTSGFKGCFNERKTLLLTSGVIGIVFDVLSLVLSIVVTVKECCECCEENCEDSECCKDWIDNAAIAFIVIPCVAVVASAVIFVLVKLDVIRLGNDGCNAFNCFNGCNCFNGGNNGGNDGGNDGGNNGGRGHGGGHGPNSNTVHSERTDTHRVPTSDRANSEGEVSRKDVHVQEKTGDNFSGRRPMPPIPLTDKKGRGLSANYDDEHPMISVGIPDKKAGDLGPLEEESKKKKKKKKKTKNDGDEREKEENKE